MRTQWFADPADGERLDETLLRLVGAVSRTLDGLAAPELSAVRSHGSHGATWSTRTAPPARRRPETRHGGLRAPPLAV